MDYSKVIEFALKRLPYNVVFGIDVDEEAKERIIKTYKLGLENSAMKVVQIVEDKHVQELANSYVDKYYNIKMWKAELEAKKDCGDENFKKIIEYRISCVEKEFAELNSNFYDDLPWMTDYKWDESRAVKIGNFYFFLEKRSFDFSLSIPEKKNV